MDDKRIIELLAKRIGRAASQQELEELSGLLMKNPELSHLYEIILTLKGSKSHFEKDLPKDELVDNGWQHLSEKLTKQQTIEKEDTANKSGGLVRKMISSRMIWAVAASVVIVFGVFIFYQKWNSSAEKMSAGKKIIEALYGNTSKIILPDGSLVRLNVGSKLIYPEKFSGLQREVVLEGEGFFEVTKNQKVPFLVHAGKITVKVLGTKFDVKAYAEDDDIETTLISGKVKVLFNDDPEKEIILSPNEKLTVTNPLRMLSTAAGNVQVNNELKYKVQSLPAVNSNVFAETAWLSNKLVFYNEDFNNVARMLERRYNVHIDFGTASLKDEHMSGVFEKENIEQALDVLKMTTHFSYSKSGNNIHIY
ncbi:MAG TPA: FecR domain-containing protein [Puia sp.]|nr:FecR domain-containing protein [Puia sp.]